MKIPEQPVSAFAVYSEKFKQKKKNKIVAVNGVSKKKHKNNGIELQTIEEMSNISQQRGDKLSKSLKERKFKIKFNKKISSTEGIKSLKKCKKPKSQEYVAENDEQNISDIEKQTFNHEHLENLFDYEMPGRSSQKNVPAAKSKLKQTREENEVLSRPEKKLKLTKNIQLKTKQHSSDGSMSSKLKKRKQYILDSNKLVSNKKIVSGKNVSTNIVQACSLERLTEPSIKKTKMKNNKTKVDINKEKSDSSVRMLCTPHDNSSHAAKLLFEWLMKPISEKTFMRDYWEKQPLLIQREGSRKYFSELLSTPEIDNMLRKNVVHFTKHLDVTSYTEEGRETHNLSGRAQANVVWDFYSNGCSVRLLNPQAFLPKIHTLNATLQEYFGCFVGANVYLTPPNSQGFAPHYDDIEAFVLQIEGKKHWKVYLPRSDNETLPRVSSPNFSQDEIGEPFLDITLEPGDLLYFPRGFIHQASTVEGEHSLHITLSAYQKTAWVDLLEKAIPLALQHAAAEDVEFRRGLPHDYLGLRYHGRDRQKNSFLDTAQKLMGRLGHYLSLSLGTGVDLMGAQFMHDALPPVFTPEEKQNSGLGGGLKMKENGKLQNRVEFKMNTQVKLIRGNICRVVEEDGEVRLYHCLDNSLEYHAEDPQFLVLPAEGLPVVTCLARQYPEYIKLSSLPHDDEDSLLALVSDLWDAGLLVTQGLTTVEEDE